MRYFGVAGVYVVTTDKPAEFSYIHDRWPRIIQKIQQTQSNT
jgi:putative SOS response-associated peptidase YedK